MNDPAVHMEWFSHVRIVIGMVVGLCITRLLTGVARYIQHPQHYRVYGIHLAWVGFMLISVAYFWWFEFGLSHVNQWRFEAYLFVIFYASLYFLTCSVLFPDRHEESDRIVEYFHARQRWFFGLLAMLFVLDMLDTAIKGSEYFFDYGWLYPMRQSLMALLAVVAMCVRNRGFHAAFVTAALLSQVAWILYRFDILH